ncbi:MAG: sigma-70 family RNA polymerase sigma factor [Deltaproteobacteria bacterium]|nr:sigma-70 family RNA polymerase sigma factor [Deltaproteobacteria bacterium]
MSPTQSIERLHRSYAAVLYDKALRLLGDRAEAEDAVQETFINAHRNFTDFVYGTSALPWLYRICTNVCLNQLRSRRRQRSKLLGAQAETTRCAPALEGRAIARAQLDTLLGLLDQRAQQILVLHFIDGFDQSEVAAQLGISRRAVVKRLAAVRRLLASEGVG